MKLRMIASLVMAAAVCGCHYTGMAAAAFSVSHQNMEEHTTAWIISCKARVYALIHLYWAISIIGFPSTLASASVSTRWSIYLAFILASVIDLWVREHLRSVSRRLEAKLVVERSKARHQAGGPSGHELRRSSTGSVFTIGTDNPVMDLGMSLSASDMSKAINALRLQDGSVGNNGKDHSMSEFAAKHIGPDLEMNTIQELSSRRERPSQNDAPIHDVDLGDD